MCRPTCAIGMSPRSSTVVACGSWERGRRIEKRVVGIANCAAFHPEDKIVAVSLDDKLVHLVDLESLEILAELRPPHPSRLIDIVFDPDGSRVSAD